MWGVLAGAGQAEEEMHVLIITIFVRCSAPHFESAPGAEKILALIFVIVKVGEPSNIFCQP